MQDSIYSFSPGLVPNSYGISNGVVKYVDDAGFWKYSTLKEQAKQKWLFLGDLVTMGIGVESDSTFAGLIDKNYLATAELNPSLIGYSSKDYLNVSETLFSQITILKEFIHLDFQIV